DLRHHALAVGEYPVMEHHEYVIHARPRVSQRGAEVRLAAPVRGEVLDEQDALAFLDMTLDLSVAPEPLGLLTNILHRQHQAIGHPGGKRDTRRLAPGDRIEALEPGVAQDDGGAKIDDGLPQPRERNQLAAIDIDRA